jgi:uncharacterized membrane protein
MKAKNAIILLCIIYTVGIIGIAIPSTKALTLSLTPINLLITLLFLLGFHKKYTASSIIGFALVASLGFFLEVAGVYSQNIFGAYHYGATLGPRHWAVPFAMGVNWLILIYTSRIASQRLVKTPLLIALLSATIMVALDFIIEPVAGFMDMWNWENNIIPLQNYVVWFVASFFIQLLYCNIEKKVANPIAIPVLLIQVVFFGLLHAYLVLQ